MTYNNYHMDGTNMATKVRAVDTILAERKQVLRDAEEMIFASVREDRALSLAELDYLYNAAGFDRVRVNDEKRRLNSVHRNQQIAGSKADREQLATLAVAAQKQVDEQVPKLEAKATEIQSEIAKIVKNRDQLVRRSDECQSALHSLCNLCSAEVANRVNERKRQIKSTIGLDVSEAEVELRHFEIMVAGPGDDARQAAFFWESVQRFDRACTQRHENGTLGPTDKWPARVEEMRKQIAVRQPELQKMQAELDRQLAELETELRQYWL